MDNGQIKLESDIQRLLNEVTSYQFHDFKNEKYAAPKIELYKKLIKLAKNVRNGDYDNGSYLETPIK